MGDLNKPNINIGMLAHVDAGKQLFPRLFSTKQVLSANLDALYTVMPFGTNKQERARGITIFSKQAVVELEKLVLRFLTHQGMLIFLLKWKEHSRFSTMQSS